MQECVKIGFPSAIYAIDSGEHFGVEFGMCRYSPDFMEIFFQKPARARATSEQW